MALILHEVTIAQLLAAFRERFRTAEKDALARLSAWLLYRMDIGDLDDNEVRTVFGLSVSEWNALVKRMRKLAEAYALVQDARGE